MVLEYEGTFQLSHKRYARLGFFTHCQFLMQKDHTSHLEQLSKVWDQYSLRYAPFDIKYLTLNLFYWAVVFEPWICITGYTAVVSIILVILIVIDYRSLNSITVSSPWVCRICIRWVSNAFQTPSSNSCSRSTTNRVKKLKRSSTLPNRDENTFWKVNEFVS